MTSAHALTLALVIPSPSLNPHPSLGKLTALILALILSLTPALTLTLVLSLSLGLTVLLPRPLTGQDTHVTLSPPQAVSLLYKESYGVS